MLTHIVVVTQYAQEAPQGGSPFTDGVLHAIHLYIYYFIYTKPVPRPRGTSKVDWWFDKGDNIVSIGGIVGEVVEVHEHTLLVNVGKSPIR